MDKGDRFFKRGIMMRVFGDLHIHTVLSPCGDLDMSPRNIVRQALKKELRILGITDHNSTRQAGMVAALGAFYGLLVLYGAEVTSKEEIHLLALFGDAASAGKFQEYIDAHLPFVANRSDLFGDQVVVDANDTITYVEPRLLISALTASLHEIEAEVHRLNGLFIPAHIDKPVNSIISQLGFIPEGLPIDALEISGFSGVEEARKKFNLSQEVAVIRNSDAHLPEDIGRNPSVFEIERLAFEEVKQALLHQNGRSVRPVVN